jgi:hypothetical protein
LGFRPWIFSVPKQEAKNSDFDSYFSLEKGAKK